MVIDVELAIATPPQPPMLRRLRWPAAITPLILILSAGAISRRHIAAITSLFAITRQYASPLRHFTLTFRHFHCHFAAYAADFR
jgi:hypothetical protein